MLQTLYSKIQTRWFEFSKSILYYPILFLIGSFLLFIVTSKIDPLIPRDFEFSLFNPIIFTGSPDAARSILSAIATGWTTILGVAFSVTLITLQLSSSKYISRLVTEFQNDKINQLTLGWFILVSSYSLLVLKTVRTNESDGIYIPILGTNISLIFAIMGLLIFVLYIHNISNYLRPNILISNLIDSIVSSLRKYENRKTDKKIIFNKQPITNKIFSIKSTKTGIITYINWEKIQESLTKYQTDKDLWMEWYKSIGDWSGKGEYIAVLYEYVKENTNNIPKRSQFIDPNIINKNNNQADNKKNNTINNDNTSINNNDHYSNNDSSIKEQIVSSIRVTKDSNLSEDPILGIKLLGEMALKSNNLRDYDVVNSVITGLFRILTYVYSSEEKLGLPFTVSSNYMQAKKIRKISLRTRKPKDHNNTTTDYESEHAEEESGKEENHQNKKKKQNEERIIIINPRELKIQDVILTTLTNISNGIINLTNTSSNEFICKQYISTCNYLLENNKINEFHLITEWYSNRLFLIKREFSDSILLLPILNLLSKFKEDISFNYPFASKTFSVFMDDFLVFKDNIVDRRDIK